MKVMKLSCNRGDGSVNKITTLGIDLAKSVFQLHGVDRLGKTVLRREIRRPQLMKVIAQLDPCLIGIEACGSGHYWARRFAEHGHRVRMMSPQFVKPYRKSDKNDRNDAEAICEAVSRPNMRFVAVKSIAQQDMQTLHRVREGLMKDRVALINRIRGLLSEYGIVISKSVSNLKRQLPDILEDAENGLTVTARQVFKDLYEELANREASMARVEGAIRELGNTHEVVRRLQTAPGIGYLTSTAMFAAVGDAKQYANGRQMAAWIGLVPRQSSSGGKQRLLGISKRGDSYLRKLLVHGARSIVTHAENKPGYRWLNALRERRGKPRAYVAQANKTARIAWAIMAKGEVYRSPAVAC
jgi:transposase